MFSLGAPRKGGSLSALLFLWGLFFWAGAAHAERIACVGDSITFGYGLSDPASQSYPAVLAQELGSEHTVENFGVSGATLQKNGDRPYWDEARFVQSGDFQPDVVVIMLGTNDAKPVNWGDPDGFAGDYEQLVEHYRGLGAFVYVATPPAVVQPGAFDISPSVVSEDVAPLVREIADSVGAPLIDVFEETVDHGDLFFDNVHPDAEGSRLIATVVGDALIATGFGTSFEPGTGGASTGGIGTGGSGIGGTSTGGSGIGGTSTGGSSTGGASGGSMSSPSGGGLGLSGGATASGGGSSGSAEAGGMENAGDPPGATGGSPAGGMSATTGGSTPTTSQPTPTQPIEVGGCSTGRSSGFSWSLLVLGAFVAVLRRRRFGC
jgi:uncharacterized protein (TIGR03382 family)